MVRKPLRLGLSRLMALTNPLLRLLVRNVCFSQHRMFGWSDVIVSSIVLVVPKREGGGSEPGNSLKKVGDVGTILVQTKTESEVWPTIIG